jgi:ABC-type Mn2+/Zn2+ transport system ATPase subunit
MTGSQITSLVSDRLTPQCNNATVLQMSNNAMENRQYCNAVILLARHLIRYGTQGY